MTDHYDTLIQSFLVKLEQRLKNTDNEAYFAIWNIVDEYKEHFKNNGIYDRNLGTNDESQ